MDEFFTRQGTRVRHGARTQGGGTVDPGTEALLKGLTFGEDAVLHDAVSIILTSPPTSAPRTPGGRRRAVPTPEPGDAGSIEIAVDVAPNETAALLMEQDGIYEWRLPQSGDKDAARRSAGEVGRRRLVFQLDLPATPTGRPAPQRRGFVDAIVGVLTDPVRAYVFKFLAGKFVGGAARLLERHVNPGLILIVIGTG